MNRPITDRDVQRVTFVDALYSNLKKQAAVALADQQKLFTLASSYLHDGLEYGECVELLMIDGLSREAAESYVSKAMSQEELENVEGLHDYSFQFEDIDGKRWSSYDIGRLVKASSDKDAWNKAEEMLDSEPDLDLEKIILVTRVS